MTPRTLALFGCFTMCSTVALAVSLTWLGLWLGLPSAPALVIAWSATALYSAGLLAAGSLR